MKGIIKKIARNLLIVSIVFSISWPAIALKSDAIQLVSIDSIKQFLDMQKNISIFTDNVVIKQGSIDIRADKAVVTYQHGDKHNTYIEAFGNPVNFQQLLENGKLVKGHAQKIRYDIVTQLLTLTHNAYLEQYDSNVTGDHITYLVQQQQMQAFSDKGKRVTTVLVLSQLQSINK